MLAHVAIQNLCTLLSYEFTEKEDMLVAQTIDRLNLFIKVSHAYAHDPELGKTFDLKSDYKDDLIDSINKF